MAGNVWEWCRNTPESYPYHRDEREQVYAHKGEFRVFRGGCWFSDAQHCRCASRRRAAPGFRYRYLGFRLVLAPRSAAKGSERSELLQ